MQDEDVHTGKGWQRSGWRLTRLRATCSPNDMVDEEHRENILWESAGV